MILSKERNWMDFIILSVSSCTSRCTRKSVWFYDQLLHSPPLHTFSAHPTVMKTSHNICKACVTSRVIQHWSSGALIQPIIICFISSSPCPMPIPSFSLQTIILIRGREKTTLKHVARWTGFHANINGHWNSTSRRFVNRTPFICKRL